MRISPKTARIGRIMVYSAFVTSAICWAIPGDSALLTAGRWLTPGMLAIHVLEFAVYIPMLRNAGRPVAPEVWPIFLYGLFHFFTLDLSGEKPTPEPS